MGYDGSFSCTAQSQVPFSLKDVGSGTVLTAEGGRCGVLCEVLFVSVSLEVEVQRVGISWAVKAAAVVFRETERLDLLYCFDPLYSTVFWLAGHNGPLANNPQCQVQCVCTGEAECNENAAGLSNTERQTRAGSAMSTYTHTHAHRAGRL